MQNIPWVPILLTLAGSAIMNLGLVLQKKGVSQFAHGPGGDEGGRFRKYITSPVWCLGMVLLIAGYGLFMRANFSREAAISLLQPIFASGVLIVALMAVVYLKERFGALEWFGVALLVGGVMLLGASAEEREKTTVVLLPRLIVFMAGCCVLIAAAIVTIKTQRHRINVEVLYGMLAGIMLGVGYLNTKTFALAMRALIRDDDPFRGDSGSSGGLLPRAGRAAPLAWAAGWWCCKKASATAGP